MRGTYYSEGPRMPALGPYVPCCVGFGWLTAPPVGCIDGSTHAPLQWRGASRPQDGPPVQRAPALAEIQTRDARAPTSGLPAAAGAAVPSDHGSRPHNTHHPFAE